MFFLLCITSCRYPFSANSIAVKFDLIHIIICNHNPNKQGQQPLIFFDLKKKFICINENYLIFIFSLWISVQNISCTGYNCYNSVLHQISINNCQNFLVDCPNSIMPVWIWLSMHFHCVTKFISTIWHVILQFHLCAHFGTNNIIYMYYTA